MHPSAEEREFEALWRAHHADVLAFVLRRVGDPQVAADVVAETFLVAWRRRREAPRDVRPWLFGVARLTLANDRRRQARARALRDRAAQGAARGSDVVLPTDDALSAEVAEAFASLSDVDQEALRLVAWDELSPREAAASLGIPAARFSVRLHRARRRLRRALEAAGRSEQPEPTGETAAVGCLRGAR